MLASDSVHFKWYHMLTLTARNENCSKLPSCCVHRRIIPVVMLIIDVLTTAFILNSRCTEEISKAHMFFLPIFLVVAPRVLGQGDKLLLTPSKAGNLTAPDQGMLINIGSLLLKRDYVVTS